MIRLKKRVNNSLLFLFSSVIVTKLSLWPKSTSSFSVTLCFGHAGLLQGLTLLPPRLGKKVIFTSLVFLKPKSFVDQPFAFFFFQTLIFCYFEGQVCSLVPCGGQCAKCVVSKLSTPVETHGLRARTHMLAHVPHVRPHCGCATVGHGRLRVSGMRPAFSPDFHSENSLGTAQRAAL